MRSARGEESLFAPLRQWLEKIGRIRADTLLARELFWFGRHVDVATLSRSGRLAAYELKIDQNGRAIEQAAYNRLVFDRSYVVTSRKPSEPMTSLARNLGIGLIVVGPAGPRLLLESPRSTGDPYLRHRVVRLIRRVGVAVDNV